MKLRTGDKVTVIAGADKGKSGKILKVLDDKVIVEGINVVKRNMKHKNNGGTGEITSSEAPIHRSNVKVEKATKSETKKETKKVTKKNDQKNK